MNYFLNFQPEYGITISSFRKPECSVNADVIGLVDDIQNNRAGCCSLEGSLEALEDGSLWADRDEDEITALHNAISRFNWEAGLL